MKLKQLFFILSILFTLSTFAQESCGTVLPANYAALKTQYNNKVMSAGAVLPHDTCLNKMLSIVFYIFLDSSGVNNVPPASLTACINQLNQYFKPICLRFESCSTRVIPEYEYNEWDRDQHEFKMTGSTNYYTDKTINIYLVDNIVVPAGKNGYAHMPGGKDLIVMKKGAITGLTPVHEMGHFFGLPHTFDEITSTSTVTPAPPSQERVRRTNCTINGDGFCDTDADPYPTGITPLTPCDFGYGVTDAVGDFYVPPVDNIMSYWGCRCRFTQEQYNFMAYMYVTMRNYLH